MHREAVGQEERGLRALRFLLATTIVSTAIHYTDNFINFEDYPQPEWLTPAWVPSVWFPLTAIGLLGYVLLKRGHTPAAYLSLLIYSYTGTSSLGHYLYGGFDEFTLRMHAFIWTDGLTGLAIVAFVLWSAVGGRPVKAAHSP